MRKEFTIYYTSDTHGHIFPVDYASGQPEASGLLNMASVIKKDGNTLVLDGGDSLQGTPLTAYYLGHRQDWPLHPVAEAFRAMGLDYFTLGNHDFNYGYQTLKEYLEAADAVCLCANVEDVRGELALQKETVHVLENGLRIGLTGVVTDFVNVWEAPCNLEGLRITDPFEAAKAACGRLKGRCDVCVCMYHGGFEKDLETGVSLSDSRENIACRLGEELDFDLLLTGHQHMAVEGVALAGAWAVQPPANAGKLLLIQGELQENMKKGFPKGFHSEFLDAGTKTSAEPYARLLPLEKQVQAWLDLPVGGLKEAIPPEGKLEAALRGSRLADLFNQVQLEATGADFSCTSLGNEPVGLSEAVTMRGITAAYLFSNTLTVLEVTEEVLRDCLERCASYLELRGGKPCISDAFLKPKIEHYNYDFYAGLSYTFDLRRPVGSRLVRLALPDGAPLGGRTYRLCVSNYRATGTGGYPALRDCPVLWQGNGEVQELIKKYIQKHSPVPVKRNGEMKVVWK